MQGAVDSAFAAQEASLAIDTADTIPKYDAGDIMVSIDTSGQITFTSKDTSGDTTLEITNGNNDGLATISFSATGEVSNSTTSGAGAAVLTLKEAAGTAPIDVSAQSLVGGAYNFNAENVTFQVTYNDGSGGPAVTGTATLAEDLTTDDIDDVVDALQASIDAVAGITAGDIVVSVDTDGFLKFTTNAQQGADVSLSIDTFTDADAAGEGLTALGLGNGITTLFDDLSFAESGTDSAITTNASGTRVEDAGKNQDAQNDTLTVTGLQGGDETITLSGTFTSQEDIVAEINGKLTNATATLDSDGVITITDNDVTEDSDGNTVGVSGNGAISVGFDGSGNATAGVANIGASGVGNDVQAIRTLQDGDLRISGVSIAASRTSDDTASNELADTSDKASSGIAIAAAINRATETTGVTASVNSTVVTGGTTNTDRVADGDQGEVYINGISAGTITLGADKETNRANAITAINQVSGQSGVTAADNGGGITLTAADGRNLSVAIDTLGTTFTGENIGLDSATKGIAEADFAGQGTSYAEVAATTSSTIRLEASKEFVVSAGTNGCLLYTSPSPRDS